MNSKKIVLGIIAIASLIASPAFAATTTPVVKATSTSTKIDYACVQSAVDTREDAIATAFTTFSSAESASLTARKSALHDAWGQTDAKTRRAARSKAWSDFNVANKSAYSALRAGKKAAWATFESASKTCHAPVVETANAEGVGSIGI